jgi:hypothetical protein
VILYPYLQTLKDFGEGAFFELAEIAVLMISGRCQMVLT